MTECENDFDWGWFLWQLGMYILAGIAYVGVVLIVR